MLRTAPASSASVQLGKRLKIESDVRPGRHDPLLTPIYPFSQTALTSTLPHLLPAFTSVRYSERFQPATTGHELPHSPGNPTTKENGGEPSSRLGIRAALVLGSHTVLVRS